MAGRFCPGGFEVLGHRLHPSVYSLNFGLDIGQMFLFCQSSWVNWQGDDVTIYATNKCDSVLDWEFVPGGKPFMIRDQHRTTRL